MADRHCPAFSRALRAPRCAVPCAVGSDEAKRELCRRHWMGFREHMVKPMVKPCKESYLMKQKACKACRFYLQDVMLSSTFRIFQSFIEVWKSCASKPGILLVLFAYEKHGAYENASPSNVCFFLGNELHECYCYILHPTA